MMATRRAFLQTTLAAAAALPVTGWADVGAPTHLSAARTVQGEYALVGLRADGSQAFVLPLPSRGHAAAAHPTEPTAVAFARRPGTYAMVIDCASGQVAQQLAAPDGHHFYGHGTYSQNGRVLFTTENHIVSGQGRIGVWDAAAGYTRLGDFSSGGIGPHEMLRQPGADVLVIANGGIRTDPTHGRAKLNLESMRPNLTHMRPDGAILHVAELPADAHQNSIRHIAAFDDGRIAIAFQWQGDPFGAPSIAGVYLPDQGIRLLNMSEAMLRGLDGYAGSVAVLDQRHIAVTFPRGGVMHMFDTKTDSVLTLPQADICGVAPARGGGMATDGLGHVHAMTAGGVRLLARHDLAFDNHLIRIGGA